MRPLALLAVALLALAACSGAPPRWADPARFAPPSAAELARRGAIEVEVETNHAAILADIGRGGGPALTAAFDTARVPERDRPARLIQLDSDYGLYAESPAALVSALRLWGDVAI